MTARHGPGPRRSVSIDSYLRETRAIAGVALLALVAGVVSDALAPGFWAHHALLAGLTSSVLTVVLTVALVNEAVERRKRQRWSVLAQYAIFQLVRDTRLVWTGVAELAGLMPSSSYTAASIDVTGAAVRETVSLAPAIGELVDDADRRRRLRGEIAGFVTQSDELLSRWAAVLLNVNMYAEVIDRYVELAGDLAWLGSLLDRYESPVGHLSRREFEPIHPCL